MPAFCRAVFAANFAEDRDISNPSVMAVVLDRLGLPAAELIAASGTPEAKKRLHTETDRARDLGVFGAPSFRVGEELFWGNDRLEQALAWALRSPGA